MLLLLLMISLESDKADLPASMGAKARGRSGASGGGELRGHGGRRITVAEARPGRKYGEEREREGGRGRGVGLACLG